MMIAHNVLLAQRAADIWYECSKVMDMILEMFLGFSMQRTRKKGVDLATPSYQRK